MWTKSDKTSPDFLSLHGATPAYITSRLPRRLRLNIFPCPSVFQLFTPDTEYDPDICTHVTLLFASISYTLKKKNVFQGCNHGNRGSLVKRTLSDREGNHGLSRELTNISTCGETEALLSIFIPTHSLFDVLRVTQRTLALSSSSPRGLLTNTGALRGRSTSAHLLYFWILLTLLQIDSPPSLPLLWQPLRDSLHAPLNTPTKSNPAPNSSLSSQRKMY